MSFSLIASPVFLKKKKKQFPDFQREIDTQIRKILENPLIGEPKRGALRGVRVLKFKYKKNNCICFLMSLILKRNSFISIPLAVMKGFTIISKDI
ncbi:MAG: type II toxin-antitoxin system RelE/ParE family toxin [Nitrospirota bacterium]